MGVGGDLWAERVPAQGDWNGDKEKKGCGSSEWGSEGPPTTGEAGIEF